VSAFLASYVYQTALIELTSAKAAKQLSVDQVLTQERNLKQWIEKQVKFSGVVDGPRLSPRALMARADQFRNRALDIMRGLE